MSLEYKPALPTRRHTPKLSVGHNAPILAGSQVYPLPSQTTLRQEYVGKDLRAVECPAAVLDLNVVRTNCAEMLEGCRVLGVGFRAHVKTHKTFELAMLQVGSATEEAKFVVSTVAEAEHLLPLLQDYQRNTRNVNVLYGMPPSSTCFRRFQRMRKLLGSTAVSFLIDHPAQLLNLVGDPSLEGELVGIYIKVDSGYKRAGLAPQSLEIESLLQVILHTQKVSSPPNIKLQGFYGHNSHSYNTNSPEEALDYLALELEAVEEAADVAFKLGYETSNMTLSVGATPQVTSIQALAVGTVASEKVTETLERLKRKKFDIELHAGNYAVLDMQQIATHARPNRTEAVEGGPTLDPSKIGMRVLAEVLSVYTERGRPEALVGAGTLALGREPCKSYAGFAVVAPSPWQSVTDSRPESVYGEARRTGWTVGRISQEHGVLTWEGSGAVNRQVRVGEKLLLWPNHACIAAAGFGWFLIVDSGSGADDASTKIVDVWVRCRGW